MSCTVSSHRFSLLALVRTALLLVILASPTLARAWVYDDFFQAAKIDNHVLINELLKDGLNPNIIEPERGDSALILALREDSMRAVRALLKAPDIDLELKSNNGDNALMIAAFKGNLEAVKALLARGAKVNRPGWTALHYAAASGSQAILQLLLKHQANPDATSPNGTTALMMAARGGHILGVKLLLDAGADVLLKNEQGYDAVEMAKIFNHTDIVAGLQSRIKKQAAAKAAAPSPSPSPSPSP
jgi:uncharacterized protein